MNDQCIGALTSKLKRNSLNNDGGKIAIRVKKARGGCDKFFEINLVLLIFILPKSCRELLLKKFKRVA